MEADEIVKGYEFEKRRYVVITDEELKSIPPETTRSVTITDFVALEEIDPIYYDKTYYLEPEELEVKAYSLLREAMSRTGKVAVAKVVLRTKETLAAVRVKGEALVLETMHYPAEIRSEDELSRLPGQMQLSNEELDMAVQLIENLADSFRPEKYDNEHRAQLMQLIEKKVAGEEVEVVKQPHPGKVVDLLAALRASLEATRQQADNKPETAPLVR